MGEGFGFWLTELALLALSAALIGASSVMTIVLCVRASRTRRRLPTIFAAFATAAFAALPLYAYCWFKDLFGLAVYEVALAAAALLVAGTCAAIVSSRGARPSARAVRRP